MLCRFFREIEQELDDRAPQRITNCKERMGINRWGDKSNLSRPVNCHLQHSYKFAGSMSPIISSGASLESILNLQPLTLLSLVFR
jgi:hypothetical protein